MQARGCNAAHRLLRHACSVPSTNRRVLILVFITLTIVLSWSPIRWPLDDFVEYWAAARLNVVGHNPYDPNELLREQRDAGWEEPRPVMMYNPPWTLALAEPIAAMDIQRARSLWLPLQLFICLWCATDLWRIYGGSGHDVVRAWALALLWMPTLVAARMGQFTPLVLLGLVAFLSAVARKRDFLGGLFFALTAVKPQLVALVWVAFLVWAVAERRWRSLAGVATALVFASAIAMLTNPRVFEQYFRLMTSASPAAEFESPNVATFVRVMLKPSAGWIQYVPTLLGSVALTMWYRSQRRWNWRRQLPGLIVCSCFVTSYGGWAFDLVVLLVPIIATMAMMARRASRTATLAACSAFAVISLAALAMHIGHAAQSTFVWMTPAVAALCLGLQWHIRNRVRDFRARLLPAH